MHISFRYSCGKFAAVSSVITVSSSGRRNPLCLNSDIISSFTVIRSTESSPDVRRVAILAWRLSALAGHFFNMDLYSKIFFRLADKRIKAFCACIHMKDRQFLSVLRHNIRCSSFFWTPHPVTARARANTPQNTCFFNLYHPFYLGHLSSFDINGWNGA